jgi:hypothetical protein
MPTPDKVVRITWQGGIPVPDQDPIEIKKSDQKLQWCADFDFKITINDYTDIKYSNGGGSSCAFSCKTGQFDQERRYKYTIHADGVDNDPNIDIKP